MTIIFHDSVGWQFDLFFGWYHLGLLVRLQSSCSLDGWGGTKQPHSHVWKSSLSIVGSTSVSLSVVSNCSPIWYLLFTLGYLVSEIRLVQLRNWILNFISNCDLNTNGYMCLSVLMWDSKALEFAHHCVTFYCLKHVMKPEQIQENGKMHIIFWSQEQTFPSA